MSIPELLAPAGGMAQLKAAVRFGTDSVYLGLEQMGMRAHADNFTMDELGEAVCFAHAHGVKVYLTLNIFAHDDDLTSIARAAREAEALGTDGVIVADPGALYAIREAVPQLPIHLSTQMNTLNAAAARFWHAQGVKRIVLSRELSLDQIWHIRENTPSSLELEVFAHGSVCMAYSGRCSLSHYMAGRDANRGDCAQPCRYRYWLLEERRPGQYFEVDETRRGVSIFSAGDLCMIGQLHRLVQAGVQSIKLEGRMKNTYYVATVVDAYRRELDALREHPEGAPAELVAELCEELNKVSHRPYDTGFYFGEPARPGGNEGQSQTMEWVAQVIGWDADRGWADIELRGKIAVGDRLELMRPGGAMPFVLRAIALPDGTELPECGRPMATLRIPLPHAAQADDLIRGTCRNHRACE